jgi:hypothetical protein
MQPLRTHIRVLFSTDESIFDLDSVLPFLISGYALAEETYRCCQIMKLSDSICHFELVAILSQACFQMYTQLKPGRTQLKKIASTCKHKTQLHFSVTHFGLEYIR